MTEANIRRWMDKSAAPIPYLPLQDLDGDDTPEQLATRREFFGDYHRYVRTHDKAAIRTTLLTTHPRLRRTLAGAGRAENMQTTAPGSGVAELVALLARRKGNYAYVPRLYQQAAIFTALISLLSLVLMFAPMSLIFINPLFAVAMLIGSPFIYAIGKRMEARDRV